MLRKNFGFGVSVRHINLLFYYTVKNEGFVLNEASHKNRKYYLNSTQPPPPTPPDLPLQFPQKAPLAMLPLKLF
jgi:hypothetical protein